MPLRAVSHACACLALATLAAAETAPAAPPAAFSSARGTHVEAVSSAGGARAQALALQLERALAAASELTGARSEKLPLVTAIELGADEGYAFLRPLSGASALLQVTPERAYLVLDASLPEQALTAAQHALAHLLTASDPDPHRPLWLEEGAAELVSTARVEGGRDARVPYVEGETRTDATVRPPLGSEDSASLRAPLALELGRPPRARLEWFSLATLHPLKRVLTAKETLRWSQHAREGLAAESWALLHYLLEGAQLGFPAREAQLARYRELVRGGALPEAACAEAFGAAPDALEAELLRFLSFGELPRRKIPLARLGVGEIAAPSTLAPADRDALLGELALSLGKFAWTPAERWLRSAALRHARAAAQLVQLRALRGDDRERVETGIAETEPLALSDAAALRALGLARLALAARDEPANQAQLSEAERLLRASAAIERHSLTTQLGLGELARLRGDRIEAETLLGDAQARMPALGGLDVALAKLALEANDTSGARAQLARVLARAHEDLRGASSEELEVLLRRARVDSGGPIATRHLTAHLEVSAPPAVRGMTSVPISGRGGRWEAAFHDVVIALDESQSTLVATGRDIDGNGRAARNRTRDRYVNQEVGSLPYVASADIGDSVVSAEVAAARRLMAQLDPDTMRVGLVSFAGFAWIDAALGHPRSVSRQLDVYAAGFHDNGTSIADALRVAFRALNDARDPERARHRAILLLSDGRPTVPTREQGEQEALEAAAELARYGVPVHTFALGPQALAKLEMYREIAARTGGRFVPVEHPADVVSLLRSVRLTGLDRVEIRNLTTGGKASGFQLRPDGSFRAEVPVALGSNAIEIVAHVEGRDPLRVRRQITVYEGAPSAEPLTPPAPESPQGTQRERELRERRTLEIETEEQREGEQR
jgi:Mg-chelatase subunit ChlD